MTNKKTLGETNFVEPTITTTMSEAHYRTSMIQEIRTQNKALKSIAASLDKIANPLIQLDYRDPDTVKKASQAIKPTKVDISWKNNQVGK